MKIHEYQGKQILRQFGVPTLAGQMARSAEEAVAAAQAIATDVAAGTLAPAAVDWSAVEARLQTAGMPDPDLIIRTSGEFRLSNFLLLQSAYAEIVFASVFWPDFDKAQLKLALAEFAKRERRFGQTGEQIQPASAP